MSRARKPREAPSADVILAIMRSTLGRWQEASQKFSTLNTDTSGRMAIGIVLDNAYICGVCGEWFMREKDHKENTCLECKKK